MNYEISAHVRAKSNSHHFTHFQVQVPDVLPERHRERIAAKYLEMVAEAVGLIICETCHGDKDKAEKCFELVVAWIATSLAEALSETERPKKEESK